MEARVLNTGRIAQRLKIVYIEDNQENRLLVITVLEAAGYTVVDAEDGRSGIDVVLRERPAPTRPVGRYFTVSGPESAGG